MLVLGYVANVVVVGGGGVWYLSCLDRCGSANAPPRDVSAPVFVVGRGGVVRADIKDHWNKCDTWPILRKYWCHSLMIRAAIHAFMTLNSRHTRSQGAVTQYQLWKRESHVAREQNVFTLTKKKR